MYGWAQAADIPTGTLVLGTSLIKPDGSHILTLPGLSAHSVAWSPDSQHIAFAGSDVFVAAYDGSDLRNLTNQGATCHEVCWSPDGSRLAFSSMMTGNWDIYAIGSDGQELVNLSNHPAEDRRPTWSPDGQRLAFDSESGGLSDIYVVDADGRNLKNLTNPAAHDWYPAWSPSDSSQLAFISNLNGDDALYLIDPDEQEPMLLYQHEAPGPNYMEPVWSPDGSQIVLLLEIVVTYTYVVDVATGEARNLAEWFIDSNLCWSPDGQYIAFGRVFFGPGFDEMKRDVPGTYIMRSNGSGLTKISSTRGILDWGMPPLGNSVDIPSGLPTSWGQIKVEAK
jgi:TolB protein